jgi:hypothetical protein
MKPTYCLHEIRSFIPELTITELIILRELVEEEDKCYNVDQLTYIYELLLKRVYDLKKFKV